MNRFAICIVTLTIVGLSMPAAAQNLSTIYGWEDQDSNFWDVFGNVTVGGVVSGSQDGYVGTPIASPNPADLYNVSAASQGTYFMKLTEQEHSGTPNVTPALLLDLDAGDLIEVSLDGWDDSASASPSVRLWFSLVDSGGNYLGSPDGTITADYTPGTGGWNASTANYTVTANDVAVTDYAGIGVQIRIYSAPSTDNTLFTDFFVDNLQIDVTTSDNNATIALANGDIIAIPEPATAMLLSLGGAALLIRRRR